MAVGDGLGPNTQHLRGYGPVLLTIVALIAFQLAAPGEDWVHIVVGVLQAVTLVAILRISGMPSARRRAAEIVIVACAVISAIGFIITEGDIGQAPALILSVAFAALAPAVILAGLARAFRRERIVTVNTMFAVLCVYLLIGIFFSLAAGLANELGNSAYFSEISDPDNSDFLYFSFVTLTTTGYGDLTAATDVGRSLAITEALFGQIFLVTVVALIVSHIGRRAAG